MNKWYRTTNGNGKKTLDCEHIERAAVAVLEGKIEGITELIIADQTVKYAEPSIDGGYRFIAHNGNIFRLGCVEMGLYGRVEQHLVYLCHRL